VFISEAMRIGPMLVLGSRLPREPNKRLIPPAAATDFYAGENPVVLQKNASADKRVKVSSNRF